MALRNAGGSTRPEPRLRQSIFITGANGFIARALARRLTALGATVTGVDLVASTEDGVVAGDITEPEAWAEALAGVDVVIHTAALLGSAHSLAQSWHVNVNGTNKVLRAAIEAGIPRFVHFSSVAAYGYDFPDGVDELHPIRVDDDAYTDTKVNAEAVVLAAHAAGEIDVTVVRPGDVWGPGSVWVREPLAEMAKPTGLPLPNKGRGIFTPVYIDNVVDAVVLILSMDESRGQVFNVTDGIGVPCSEYFGRLAEMSGGRLVHIPMGAAEPLADVVGRLMRRFGVHTELSRGTMRLLNRPGTYSIDKARKVLGYEPLVTFDEGMEAVRSWATAEGLIEG